LKGKNQKSRRIKKSFIKNIHELLSINSSENAAIKDLIEIIASKKKNKEINLKLKCQCVPKIMLVDDNDFNLMPLNLLISQLFQIKTELAFNGQ
jgi:hypothetical protein